jgi:competence protein ComEA
MGIAAAVLVAGVVGAKYLRSVDAAKTDATQGLLRVNLNTATLTELESIPGIGVVLAKQIVANRPYASVDDLLKIRGIGERSVQGLRTYVKVEGETEKLR